MTGNKLSKQATQVMATAANMVRLSTIPRLIGLSELDALALFEADNPPLSLVQFHPFEDALAVTDEFFYSDNEHRVQDHVNASSVYRVETPSKQHPVEKNSGVTSSSNCSPMRDREKKHASDGSANQSALLGLSKLLGEIDSLSSDHHFKYDNKDEDGRAAYEVHDGVSEIPSAPMTSVFQTIQNLIASLAPTSSAVGGSMTGTMTGTMKGAMKGAMNGDWEKRSHRLMSPKSTPLNLTSLNDKVPKRIGEQILNRPSLLAALTGSFYSGKKESDNAITLIDAPNTKAGFSGDEISPVQVKRSEHHQRPGQYEIEKSSHDSSDLTTPAITKPVLGAPVLSRPSLGFIEKGSKHIKSDHFFGQYLSKMGESTQSEGNSLHQSMSLSALKPSDTMKVAEALSDYLQEQASLHGVDLS